MTTTCIAAGLFLRVLASGLRYAHATCATLSASTSTPRTRVSDFVSFFDLSTYQDGVQTGALDNFPSFRKDKIQQSRLRSAWEFAGSEFSRALLKTSNIENAAEGDAPQDPDVQHKQEQAFKGLHRLRLEPDATPCDTLFARLFREFKRQTLSVIPLHKVKTVARTSPIMDTVKERRLSADIIITLNEADDTETEITDFLQLLRALRVLMAADANLRWLLPNPSTVTCTSAQTKSMQSAWPHCSHHGRGIMRASIQEGRWCALYRSEQGLNTTACQGRGDPSRRRR